jgi:hypothetical protein
LFPKIGKLLRHVGIPRRAGATPLIPAALALAMAFTLRIAAMLIAWLTRNAILVSRAIDVAEFFDVKISHRNFLQL